MKVLVTGAAGFIGSHFVDHLLAIGRCVVGYDNLSTGRYHFLSDALLHPQFCFEQGDLLDTDHLKRVVAGTDLVIHLAANADIRFGTQHPRKDLDQNTIGTWNVLEAMRQCDVRRIVFASTGSVYGEPNVFPTPEDSAFPIQTSLYGASKLAAEAFIEAYCAGFGMQANIFRFVSMLGPRYTHGHVIDFYNQLRQHPEVLYVLGDGHQRKSYLHVSDCIEAVTCALERACNPLNRFNLGTAEYCEVNGSIRWITEYMGLSPRIIYSGGDRGWSGDNPFIFLDCSRIRSLGWQPRYSIRESVLSTLQYLERNEHIIPCATERKAV